ncbi:MAG: hypothetical protein D3916_03860 [Candidatus Electrothrix sp. MAN1_4]|nr:hypothetical protein [Candidatus Electrothrix sp. MAN1_4]
MKNRINTLLFLTLLSCFCCIYQGNAADCTAVSGASYPGMKLEKMNENDSRAKDLLRKSMNAATQARKIDLNRLDTIRLHAMLSRDSSREIIGVPRKLEVLKEKLEEKKGDQWDKCPDGGHTSTFIFTSAGAAALRIGITVNNLPRTSELRFFKKETVNNTAEFVVTGKEINKLIQLNKTADPDNKDADVYWSPVIEGESLGIEIYTPPDVEPDDVRIAFSTLSHLAVSPFSSSDNQFIEQSIEQSYGESDACQNDATCFAAWLDMRNAVAKMVYTDSGATYTCTGTLLNDTDTTTWKPYFISANHCIASQTVASTLQTHWFFESSRCDGTTQNANYTTRNSGATLLWTRGTTTSQIDTNQDASLFLLHDMPPAGVYYAGWDTSNIPVTNLTGIHHPMGDWKKISFCNNDGSYKCYMDGAGFSCTPSDTGGFLGVKWTDGGTEIGSSGSGIFNNNGELIGVLKGGNGVCGEGGFSVYSKFSAAYSAGNLRQWLNTAPSSGGKGSIVPMLYLLLK